MTTTPGGERMKNFITGYFAKRNKQKKCKHRFHEIYLIYSHGVGTTPYMECFDCGLTIPKESMTPEEHTPDTNKQNQ
jgi:hypothetical protein